jgi:tetratricopeptide (TPR) repeat protein
VKRCREWGLLAWLCIATLSLAAQNHDSLAHAVDLNTSDGMNQLRRSQLDPHALVYEKATQLGDWVTAIDALHHLLLQDPENAFLQDSLAALYFRVGNLSACHAWSLEKLQQRPQDLLLLQLVGTIEEQKGKLEPALERYQRIFALTKVHFYRYKMAGLQFLLGRYGECGQQIESMLLDPEIDQQAVHIDWNNGGGDVPLRSALLNLRGNMELALNKENHARKSFKEALKLAPEFLLARNNLDALQTKYRSPNEENGR